VTAIGLTLDILGIIVVFVFAPERYPDPQSSAGFALGDKKLRPRWRKNQRRRTSVTRIGVSVIVIGFLLQIIAVVLL